MNDVWSELEERLKQKAKTGTFIMILVAHNREEKEKKWVRLENILGILKQLREQYDLVPKDFFDLFTSL